MSLPPVFSHFQVPKENVLEPTVRLIQFPSNFSLRELWLTNQLAEKNAAETLHVSYLHKEKPIGVADYDSLLFFPTTRDQLGKL
jgi:hypothetical protein